MINDTQIVILILENIFFYPNYVKITDIVSENKLLIILIYFLILLMQVLLSKYTILTYGIQEECVISKNNISKAKILDVKAHINVQYKKLMQRFALVTCFVYLAKNFTPCNILKYKKLMLNIF